MGELSTLLQRLYYLPVGCEGAWRASGVTTSINTLNMIRGFFGSFEYTLIRLENVPLLPVVDTCALIFPLSSGAMWLELATAAVQPQLEVTFLIINSDVPLLVNSKKCSTTSPCFTPAALNSISSNTNKGSAVTETGITINAIMISSFFIIFSLSFL